MSMNVGACKALPRCQGRGRAVPAAVSIDFLLMAALIIAAKITNCCVVGTFISL